MIPRSSSIGLLPCGVYGLPWTAVLRKPPYDGMVTDKDDRDEMVGARAVNTPTKEESHEDRF